MFEYSNAIPVRPASCFLALAERQLVSTLSPREFPCYPRVPPSSLSKQLDLYHTTIIQLQCRIRMHLPSRHQTTKETVINSAKTQQKKEKKKKRLVVIACHHKGLLIQLRETLLYFILFVSSLIVRLSSVGVSTSQTRGINTAPLTSGTVTSTRFENAA